MYQKKSVRALFSERDLKAYLESAEERKEKNEALILNLRQENRQKRLLIQDGIMVKY